jgi:LAO/AO transport system kinase
LEIELLWEGLCKGDRLSLSRAITLIETGSPEKRQHRNRLMQWVEARPRNGYSLAVTGLPGAGKSSLIDRLGMHWIGQGHRVAVLAVDPSSGISQGSVLGDKTRMTELSKHPAAFIRPSPTRLELGGVAASTFETMLLCEVAGFNRIIIETVGVGQSETLASSLTDACLLVLVAGTGDDLQGVKKGILESADLVLVNKADSGNEERVAAVGRELRHISSLWPLRANGAPAAVLTGSAWNPGGLEPLFSELETYFQTLQENGAAKVKRMQQKKEWYSHLVRKLLSEELQNGSIWSEAVERLAQDPNTYTAVHQAAETLIAQFRGKPLY